MVTLKNVHFSGLHTGITAHGGSIHAENVTFDNVTTPFNLSGIESGYIKGTRITNDPKLQADKVGGKSSTGWRRPKGPPLPIFCPNCKSICASKNYVFGGLYFQCWDNKETCSECGVYGAFLSDGLFNLTEEVAKAMTAPDITYAMLRAILNVAEELLEGGATPEQAIAKVNEISPRFALLVEKANRFGKAAVVYVGLVIAAASAYYAGQSVVLGRKQLEFAEEENKAQKADDESAQQTLERVLNRLADLHVAPDRRDDPGPPKKPHQPHPKPPSKQETPDKAGAR